ncbi:MAG: NYN domain-containing protein [bacterium]|nr:NYN domain-containing protein [bacterium]
MKENRNNYAFIDSQNLNLSIRQMGWRLNFAKFRQYLSDKYGITHAFLFIGFVRGNEAMYTRLQRDGFICVFKPTLELPDGSVKGNVDAELVLHTMIQYPHFEKAVIVTGDGDFYCLVEYLRDQEKLLKLLIPDRHSYSGLFKRLSTPEYNIFDFIDALRGKLEFIKK